MLCSEEVGYQKYGLPKPGALLMAYPMYKASGLCQLMMSSMTEVPMSKEDIRRYSADRSMTEEYPPTYYWFGWNDLVMILFDLRTDLACALSRAGVEHELVMYGNAPHACGDGYGTDADGWLSGAVEFWERVITETDQTNGLVMLMLCA